MYNLKFFVMNNKLFISDYEAPQVEIIEVEVEKGFAVSTTGEDANWV